MTITNTLPASAALAVLVLLIQDAVRGGRDTRSGWRLVTAGLALVTLAVSAGAGLSGLAASAVPLQAVVSLGGVIVLALGIRRWSSGSSGTGPVKVNDDMDGGKGVAKAGEADDRYRALFEESMDAVFIISADGRFTDINPAGVELLGYESAGELESVKFHDDLWASSPRCAEGSTGRSRRPVP